MTRKPFAESLIEELNNEREAFSRYTWRSIPYGNIKEGESAKLVYSPFSDPRKVKLLEELARAPPKRGRPRKTPLSRPQTKDLDLPSLPNTTARSKILKAELTKKWNDMSGYVMWSDLWNYVNMFCAEAIEQGRADKAKAILTKVRARFTEEEKILNDPKWYDHPHIQSNHHGRLAMIQELITMLEKMEREGRT